MTALWLLLSLWQATTPPPSPLQWKDLSEGERAQVMTSLQGEPFEQRLLDASTRFLNIPYVFSPLGEGEGKDPDPSVRFDAADCLSMVEETLAISLAQTPDQFQPWLERIRYGPSISYEGRNHLMEAQWLPHAESLGVVHPITSKYGGTDTQRARTVITPASWQSLSSKELDLPPERRPVGTFAFDLIPLAKVGERLKGVPTGTLMVVVRDERPFKVTRMTHLGLVIQKGHRVFLRHASKSRHGRVVDEDLREFLERNSRYDKWPVTGVSLFALTQAALPVATTPAFDPLPTRRDSPPRAAHLPPVAVPSPSTAPVVHATAGAPAP